MHYLFAFVLFPILSIVAIILVYKWQKPKDTSSKIPSSKSPYISWDGLSPEELSVLEKASIYCGTRNLTPRDLCRYNLHTICELFQSMPGWRVWDKSIHEASGQYERMERAATTNLQVLSYDPRYQLAKVYGKTFNVYLTSSQRCSCPDFRKRHLPCKHMYCLAMELNGNCDTAIIDVSHPPLYGLKFSFAGRFPGRRDSLEGIRHKINSLGGTWSDEITIENSALITGKDPSQRRLDYASQFDMEILSSDVIENLFSQEIKADRVPATRQILS